MKRTQKPKEDERTKLILHFNINKTLIIRNIKEYNNVEYSLKKIIASQVWGKQENKAGINIFRTIHPELEFDQSKINDSDQQTYLSFIEEQYPLKSGDTEEDILSNNEQLRKRVGLILDVIEPNNPGVKFKKQFEDMKKKIRMDDKISQDFNFKLDTKKLDYKVLSEHDNLNFLSLDEREKFIFLFKNAYHSTVVSFYNMILQLIKNKRRFVIIFRFFDIPISFAEEFIYEFNAFCNGKHPKYCGQNGTQLQKLEGTNKNKDFRISYDFTSKTGENVGFFVRNSKEPEKENLVWESLNFPDQEFDDELRGNIEELYEGDEENAQNNMTISKGYNDIMLSTYEKLSQFCTIAFFDDCTLYNKSNKYGKLFVIDPCDYETLQIWFDSDLQLEQNKLDVIDIATGKKLNNESCMDKYIVNVDPRRAVIDLNYFLSKIEQCENNRQNEIIKLTAKEFPLMPISSDFDLKKEIHRISSDNYLEMTVFPLLQNALNYVDEFRPNDPLIHIANYLLKNKESVKNIDEYLISDFNDKQKKNLQNMIGDMNIIKEEDVIPEDTQIEKIY